VIRNLLTPLMMVVTLLFWANGCSDSPIEPGASENLNLEDEFGGYTASMENPGFGDPELVDEAASDTVYNDEILASPEVGTIISCPRTGYYHLRAVWGRLCYDSVVTEVTDWTGSLSVSCGVEVIRRVIRFEPGQDYIIRPRTDPKLIEWVSKTTVHNDGIAVDIFVPPIFDTTEVAKIDSLGDTSYVIVIDTSYSATVSFETGPYSRTFELEELRSLDTVVYLDDSNAVAFHSFELHRYPCQLGFLAGRWGFDENGEGRFRGVWWSKRPSFFDWYISGYLKGHFGKNDSGAKVFYGKWISRTGEFKGFLKGTYDHPHCQEVTNARMKHAHGWFAGKIFNANRIEIGVLKGRYRSAPWHKNGFFQGWWKLNCNAIESDPDDNKEGF